MIGFLLGRDGKLSMFRVGLAAAAVGILFTLGGFVVFSLEGNSYKSPLYIDPFPGARDWGTQTVSAIERNLLFQIEGSTPEQVLEYYQKKLDDIYHGDPNEANSTCRRFPPAGNFPEFDNGKPGVVAYFYNCTFERAGLRAGTQSTIVTIQPGVKNADPKLNTEGMTVVQYRQQWES